MSGFGQAPDLTRVREELISLKEPERRRRAKAAEEEFRRRPMRHGEEPPSERSRAAALTWVGTATARTVVTGFWRIAFDLQRDPELADDVYAVLAARGRAFFTTLARGFLRGEGVWGTWPLVRRAVCDGLIEPPEGDEYIRGVVFGVSPPGSAMHELESTYEGLLADPRLLDAEVWQLFEIDAGGPLSNSNTWQVDMETKPEDRYTRGDNRWLYALTRLADEGRLDRRRLLDASLDALMRDFRASSVGWYAKLHEELEPTREERVERLDRYLALVTSPAPVVVKEGLAALGEIEDAVPPHDFARVAPTPFTQRQKHLSMETLSLLARLCKQHTEARADLLESAAHALAHPRADVQERALKLLEQYPDDVPRASLLGYVDAASATLRPRVEQLTGLTTTQGAPVDVDLRAPTQPRPTLELVVERCAELAPVESVDELIELAAMLLEGQGNGDDCERFLEGVSRLCDRRPSGFERRTAGLVRRAEAPSQWGGPQVAGVDVLAVVVQAWTRRRRPPAAPSPSTVLAFLAGRAGEVARRARRGISRPLLGFPTHSGGWIDPDVLDARTRAAGRFFNRPDPVDRLQAALRAFPPIGPLGYEREVRTTSGWWGTNRELQLACLSVPTELDGLAAAVARPGAGDGSASWYGAVGWAGLDALGVRWALTVLPSLPEVAFAGAANAAVEARERTSYRHPEAVIEWAVDPHVPLGREAWLATAACLVAKSPDVPRTAVDLLVAAIEDGRFDANALGAELAWLLDNDFAKVNRLEAPLREAARVSALHAAQTTLTVEATLGQLATRPHGLHALLEVGLESATTCGRRIDDERARAALGRLAADSTRSSKLGKLARSLLAR